MSSDRSRFWDAHLQANLIAGLLAITPFVVVWVVFDFFLNVLSVAGQPLALGLTEFIDRNYPAAAPFFASITVRWLIGVVVALLALYSIGAVVSRVAGQRLFALFERLIARIPMVQTIYSAAKQLIDVLRQPPGGGQRVVLIDFPQAGMKTLGFVMRTFRDSKTGEDIAAVYVPTALNPTCGYLQITPLANLTPTDLAPDQAMTMIISGGAVAPDRFTIASS